MLRYLTAENRTGNISVADVQKDLAMSREEIEADLRLLNLVNHGGGTYLITASMGDESIEVTPEPAGQALAEPVRLFPMMARAVSLALDLLEGQVALEGKTPLESVRRKLSASSFLRTDSSGVLRSRATCPSRRSRASETALAIMGKSRTGSASAWPAGSGVTSMLSSPMLAVIR